MTTEIKAPTFPESVADGVISTWHKAAGDYCRADELIADVETDKVVMEVMAPADGVLEALLVEEGDTVESNQPIARLSEGEVAQGAADPDEEVNAGPAARRLIEEYDLEPAAIEATGRHGGITKEDVLRHLKENAAAAEEADAQADTSNTNNKVPTHNDMPAHEETDSWARLHDKESSAAPADVNDRLEKRVPMTRLRATIAKRLVEAQHEAAMLTTYNEVNMKPLMDLRKKYKDLFEKTHSGARLGMMSFFIKAACEALKRFPAVNASIDGNDMVYHGYQDIGVAVSTDRGLMVPILRDAETLSMAEIESGIADFAARGRDGKLGMEEMQGGTFTITNGGVFGSLMSTPILNPPQTAILGMHKIQERPMAVDGEVVILPMMYLALSYDHRMIDGKEAVQFLVTIKELLEDPARMLLEV